MISAPKPTRPWTPTLIQRLVDVLVIVVSMVLAIFLVATTPLKGKLALVALIFLIYLMLSTIFRQVRSGSASAKNGIVQILVTSAALIAITPIVSIVATVVSKGIAGISFNLFTKDMSLATPTDPLSSGGLLHAITGTTLLVFIALILSLPIGILTALYITEVKGRLTRPIRFLVQAMSGVPSVVAGLFILSAVLYPITKQYSGLMGSLALTILMIPTIARTSEEVLKLIPNDLREAGVALGGTQWRTVVMIVIPAARSGLVTAMILGIARIAGETAPLLLLTGGGDRVNLNPVAGPMGSLPFYIWKSFNAGSAEGISRAWAGLLVLLLIVLILFISARALISRKKI